MFQEIKIKHGNIELEGHLSSPGSPRGWVIFAHGSGSSRKSSRNNWVAGELNKQGFATLLFDLLTIEEDVVYQNRFNIPLLADRLLSATKWLLSSNYYHGEPLAYFGASTGAGAALIAAARADSSWPLYTVISRGGRPDLAGVEHLRDVSVPVLLIVGSLDYQVIQLNQYAENHLTNVKLSLVEGATHLFEEPGTLDAVVKICGQWLDEKLPDQKEAAVWQH